jgi:hypothetical protein
MTPKQRDELVRLAAQVALDASLRQNPYTVDAYVRWSTVNAIRAALDDAGIDWRAHHRQTKARAK